MDTTTPAATAESSADPAAETDAAAEARLFARLEALGIASRTIRHPAAFTVEQAQRVRGDLAGGHCKNLFLKDKRGALWLVVCLEQQSVDMRRLERTLGAARLSFGRPELLREVLGAAPGSVSPFALINDPAHRVTAVLDRAMLNIDPLNYHPLHNTATTQIAAADLERFIAACGHTVRRVDFA